MRYRRFGRSDLEVSEVGSGVWALASDWWGADEQSRLDELRHDDFGISNRYDMPLKTSTGG